MIIYSEILGKPFNSVEECLNAEKQHELKLQEDEARKKAEKDKLEKAVHDNYNTLVNSWIDYMKAVNKAGYDIDSLEEMALIFVEVISDADSRQDKAAQS